MKPEIPLTRARATTPRAAAVAGILFSVLLIASLVLVRITVPPHPEETGAWLTGHSQTVALGLNLVPFAGIAFLWFIGVVRDRIGEHEDRFFATVFLGSGLLSFAMLLASAEITGGVISMFGVSPGMLINSGLYAFGRTVVYELMTVYTMKMAGVFMMTTCTLFVAHRHFPALDGVPGRGAGAVPAAEHELCFLVSIGISALDPADQHPYPAGESQKANK